jgi:cytochrome c biogenesis protein CcdA
MLALLALALSVGIVDSINPSTVGPALYIAAGSNAVRSLALFTAGAFAVYTTGGIVLALGPGEALPQPSHRVVRLLELGVGAGAVVLAVALWLARGWVGRRLQRQHTRTGGGGRGPLLLGAGIMAVELPTAFPYFAVIVAVAGSGRSVVDQVGALLLFNLAFVAPLLGILALRAFAGPRGERALESLRGRIDAHGAELVSLLVLAIGIILLVLGLT